MKYKLILILALLSVSLWLHSTIWEVNQDGSGDFITVQQGIDAAANNDTVLVYPGTYYENLTILNKPLTLGSLYLTTGDESYISQTIFDGNQNSSVVRIENTPTSSNVIVKGFIIQNGVGYTTSTTFPHKKRGGGFYIDNSVLSIVKCTIQNNTAWVGGGFYLYDNIQMNLIGNTIKKNHAFKYGGGIYMAGNIDITYDPIYLNNIYFNYAGCANDIFVSYLSPFQNIIVDTFTVVNPSEDYYYIYPTSDAAGYPLPGLFSIDIQHAKLQQVDSDLYVAADGDDNNSGTNASEPLQTIAFALNKIHSDSLNHKTIHISDGVYSKSSNNQIFPAHLKSNVDLIGESRDGTILDADQLAGQFYACDPQQNISIENLSLKNSCFWSNVYFGESTGIFLNNLKITDDDFGIIGVTAIRAEYTDMELDNLLLKNNLFQGALYFYSPKNTTNLTFSNSIIINNSPSNVDCHPIMARRSTTLEDSLNVNIVNTQIVNNLDCAYEWLPSISGIYITYNTNLNLVNSTLANNTCQNDGAGLKLKYSSTASITNSIIFGNTPYNICLDNLYMYDPNYLNAWNSLIEGGQFNQLIIGLNYINWDDLTMLDEDPLFLNQEDYSLSVNSPCIDTGTLELPYGVELPAYDLAGNPRVMGSNIDMGAYEYPGNAAPIYLEIDNENLSWQIPPGFAPDSYNVYLDDEFQINLSAFQMEYILHNLIIGQNYKAGVSAVYSGEETAIIPKYFTFNPVGIEENTQHSPLTSHLLNYPNPFNPATTISFNVTQKAMSGSDGSAFATLEIFNIKGQKVKTLLNSQLSAGHYECIWNGKDSNNKRVSTGEYFAKLKIDGKEVEVQKMLLMK